MCGDLFRSAHSPLTVLPRSLTLVSFTFSEISGCFSVYSFFGYFRSRLGIAVSCGFMRRGFP